MKYKQRLKKALILHFPLRIRFFIFLGHDIVGILEDKKHTMQSVQQTIIKLNNNFQKLHFENNLIFFSEILPEKIFEIKNFFILVHEKFPLPYGIEDLIRKTNLEQECINEQFIGNDLSYWQKDGHLNTCKIKIAECLYKFYHDCYYPGILKKMI